MSKIVSLSPHKRTSRTGFPYILGTLEFAILFSAWVCILFPFVTVLVFVSSVIFSIRMFKYLGYQGFFDIYLLIIFLSISPRLCLLWKYLFPPFAPSVANHGMLIAARRVRRKMGFHLFILTFFVS